MACPPPTRLIPANWAAPANRNTLIAIVSTSEKWPRCAAESPNTTPKAPEDTMIPSMSTTSRRRASRRVRRAGAVIEWALERAVVAASERGLPQRRKVLPQVPSHTTNNACLSRA